LTDSPGALMGHGQLTTIDQSELSSQLGLSLGGSSILPPAAQSPEERLSTTPSPTSSLQEDEPEEFRRQVPAQKAAPVVLDVGRKQKPAKKQKKKKDPNEPQKPVSAYALFFRDTQAAIKGQNPNATFGEVSKIVASMWDSLGEEQKQVYKRKTEAAKKEYLKALAAYRAIQVRQPVTLQPEEASPERPSPEPQGSPEPVEMITADVVPEVESPTQMDVELVSESPVGLSPRPRCVRSGCDNLPVSSSDWDNEYCSSECVVKHCRDVFLAWLASRNSSSSVVFVK
uniref:TOX high mobility group box family member 4 n=1 Tax=Chrysemys picta bellii TaxID=8478 RepID=A0A8C3HFM1_CHRPI